MCYFGAVIIYGWGAGGANKGMLPLMAVCVYAMMEWVSFWN